jgi:hypothetical protein
MFIVEKNRKFHTNLGDDPRAHLDPDKLYQEQYAHARATATGVGKLVFEFIPFSVIRSFALAIDPLKKFRALPIKITSVNRTRVREVQSVLDTRKYRRYRNRRNYLSFIWSTRGGPPGMFCYSPPELQATSGVTLQQAIDLPKQTASVTTTKDTTSRTRPPGSELGEFEHFAYKITSPTLNVSMYQSRHNEISMSCNNQVDWTDDFYYTDNTGPAAVMSKAALDGLRTSEITELETLMQQRVLGMLSRTVPMSRRYSAFRNVAELKDLPRSILSLKRALENFNNSFHILPLGEQATIRKYLNSGSKGIPGEYVSYHFGWKQIYKDVMDLLEKPVRAAREVNRLMRRSGQPTTFRSFSKFAGKTTDTPAFNYDAPTFEQFAIQTRTEHRRQHELRCVVNATFDFPKVNVPTYKKDLLLHKLGVNPMPTDLYNLIPWSWLVDWFTGLGNYVEAIDTINTDKSLINWGLLTGITKGEITTTRSFRVDDYWYRRINGTTAESWTQRYKSHQSILNYTLQIRRNVTSAYGVKTILEPSSLSLYQQSILAAILASRRK